MMSIAIAGMGKVLVELFWSDCSDTKFLLTKKDVVAIDYVNLIVNSTLLILLCCEHLANHFFYGGF